MWLTCLYVPIEFDRIQPKKKQKVITNKMANKMDGKNQPNKDWYSLTGNYSVYGFQIKLSRSLGPFLLSVRPIPLYLLFFVDIKVYCCFCYCWQLFFSLAIIFFSFWKFVIVIVTVIVTVFVIVIVILLLLLLHNYNKYPELRAALKTEINKLEKFVF